MLAFPDKQRLLLSTADYICLLPHISLRKYISNYNITVPNKALMPDRLTIMPSGCASLNLEFDHKNMSVLIEGPRNRPYVTGAHSNQVQLLITIEFKPAGLYALTKINQSELVNGFHPLDLVNTRMENSLSELAEKADNAGELSAYLDNFFMAHLKQKVHPQLGHAVQTITENNGNLTVKRLSDEVHYSERQLNRIFIQQIGISPKAFARLIRVNHAFHLLKKPALSLTLVSDFMGFHDLSHFTRDFKNVSGIHPQEFRRNLSDFYINPRNF